MYVCLAGFLRTLSPNGPFAPNSFFRPKTISKVAIIKTRVKPLFFFFFFSFPSPRSFSFVTMILELFGLRRNVSFDAFSLKWLQILLGWFSKNWLDVRTYVCMYVCMCVCMCVCTYVCMHACLCACMYVCMYVCMHACMHVCIYKCIQ